MEKVIQEIKVVETEKGLRIEVTGEGAKDWAKNLTSGIPAFGMACCCVTDTEKKD